MKQKSLRQLARELGVSHSYLSQVRHGKRPASDKVVSKMVSNGKQNRENIFDTTPAIRYNSIAGPLAQLAEQLTLNSRPGVSRGSFSFKTVLSHLGSQS